MKPRVLIRDLAIVYLAPGLVRACLVMLLACGASSAPAPTPVQPGDLVFTGMCDASGAVALSGERFVVADDEDNVLRVYDSVRGGAPIETVDVSAFLALPKKKKPPEADIEAATQVGNVALWLTSHGLNSKGKLQQGRFRMFATSLGNAGPIAPVGTPYERLLDDLLAAPQLANLGLRAASQIAPKESGGLNIEGMTEREGNTSVFIGFRNPRPQNRAIVIPLLNPLAIVEGQRAAVGDPILLDLGGLGIRGMSRWRGQYLILGGAVAREADSRLFGWDGVSTEPQAVTDVDLTGFNPEGFVSYDDKTQVLLLSDDGGAIVDGEECKRLADVAKKRFRARWITIDQQ